MSRASRQRRSDGGKPNTDQAPGIDIESKTCAVCAVDAAADAPTCLSCGEASWLPDDGDS